MQYSPDPTSPRSSSVGSDRLRKAIERNRAKQSKRAASTTRASSKTIEMTPSKWEAPASKATSKVTRRAVASRAEDLEFSTEIRKAPRKAPAAVSYSGTKRRATSARATTTRAATRTTAAQRKAIDKKKRYLVLGGWAFCAFLMLRLIFSAGGVIDYYSSHSALKDKDYEHKSILQENKELVAEIQKIKNNRSYQKKLVRDNLGFIAKDEFLILFPKEGSSPSI